MITEALYSVLKELSDAGFCDCTIDEVIEQLTSEANIDDRLPDSYAEVEYDDFESAEAIDGARFDDLNYQHYMER